MIFDAKEFIRLRTSEDVCEQNRASHEAADELVWLDVIQKFPKMKKWVVHNKTVSIAILKLLACDENVQVRRAVARKRKLNFELFALLAADRDEGVRHDIASNANCPANIRARLAIDSVAFVANAVREYSK
jgi:hypothetical protein